MSRKSIALSVAAFFSGHEDDINANFTELYTSTPLWVKVGTLTYADFSTAGTSQAANLFQLPAGAMIHATRIKHSVAFAGGAISAYTVAVGISGTANKYAAAFNVHQAVGNTAFQDSTPSALGAETLASATQIIATATSTGANTNAATAGSVDVWCQISQPPS